MIAFSWYSGFLVLWNWFSIICHLGWLLGYQWSTERRGRTLGWTIARTPGALLLYYEIFDMMGLRLGVVVGVVCVLIFSIFMCGFICGPPLCFCLVSWTGSLPIFYRRFKWNAYGDEAEGVKNLCPLIVDCAAKDLNPPMVMGFWACWEV